MTIYPEDDVAITAVPLLKFPEASYLDANPDVKEAVDNGQFRDGKHHYDAFGKNENRKGLEEWTQN